MKRLLILLPLVLLVGCTGPGDVPAECEEVKGDVCALYDCMVDLCWCNDIGPDGPILSTGFLPVTTEEAAWDRVQGFVGDNVKVERVFDLNSQFYAVYADDEEYYTVAKADGTIFLTICGV